MGMLRELALYILDYYYANANYYFLISEFLCINIPGQKVNIRSFN